MKIIIDDNYRSKYESDFKYYQEYYLNKDYRIEYILKQVVRGNLLNPDFAPERIHTLYQPIFAAIKKEMNNGK